MNQNDYATIIACIQHGAPALADKLILGLNTVVEGNNNWVQHQRDIMYSAKQAEAKAARKAKREANAKGQELPQEPKGE